MSDNNEPRRVPAKKPGETTPSGPAKTTANSMKDRLLAERRAAEAAAGGPPPTKPVAGAPKPAAAGHAPAKPAPAKPVAGHGPSPAAKPAARPVPTTVARPAAAPSTAHRAHATREGSPSAGARRHHREPKPKEKSPIPYIATGLVLIAAVVAGYMYMNMSASDPDPADAGGTVAAADAAATPAGDVPAEDAPADAATETPTAGTAAPAKPDVAAAAPPELTAEEAEALKATKSLPSAKDPDSWNQIAITKNPNQVNDPNGVDLNKVTPYGKPPGVDDAQWATLTADAKSMFDPLSGAKGNRAETRLLEAGIAAWPAVTNEMLRLDPKRPEDNRTGKRAEKLLDKIRGGTTDGGFNWRMPATSEGELERKDLFYNLQLIVELHDVWRRHLASPDRYFREKIAKGKVQEEMMGKTPEAEADELDVDKLDLSDLGGG